MTGIKNLCKCMKKKIPGTEFWTDTITVTDGDDEKEDDKNDIEFFSPVNTYITSRVKNVKVCMVRKEDGKTIKTVVFGDLVSDDVVHIII